MTNKVEILDQPYKCTHCGKSFMKERTLYNHMCERKRRFLQKDEKRVQLGFMAFNRFFVITQNQNTKKSYEEFCQSSYYNAFVKFGSFMNNVKPIYPEKFVDYVIKSGVKLDHWCQERLYEKYLVEMLKIEPVDSAIERTIETMINWGDKNNSPYNHYFRYATSNRIVHDIKNGKISPWVILNCESGKKSLDNLTDEQLELISTVIDLIYWKNHFKKMKSEINIVENICRGANIE